MITKQNLCRAIISTFERDNGPIDDQSCFLSAPVAVAMQHLGMPVDERCEETEGVLYDYFDGERTHTFSIKDLLTLLPD